MKKNLILVVILATVGVMLTINMCSSNSLTEDKQKGSLINLDYHTPVEKVVRQDGNFVEVEGGMVYSLPRYWRNDLPNLEGKNIQIRGTRHLRLEGLPLYINDEKVVGHDVTSKGTAIRLVTNYDTYTYSGTVLLVYSDTSRTDVYRIYRPHRYVAKKK